MTQKRFIKFELTQLDDATIDYGVKDSMTDKWYHTINNKNARELTDLLNEQDQQIKKTKEILQKHYDYAYNQRQKNLENAIVAEVYDVLRYTVAEIADELGIAIKK